MHEDFYSGCYATTWADGNRWGYFSLLKRGVIGTFHHVSKKHLPLYLAEFDHRYNHRKVSDGERTIAALQCAEGKRLTLKPLKRGVKP